MDWWVDSVLGDTVEGRNVALSKLPPEIIALLNEKGLNFGDDVQTEGTLPPELLNMVREHFQKDTSDWFMTADEAREHREKLMDERSAFDNGVREEWYHETYSFCEH
jgi:hypothetical protein